MQTHKAVLLEWWSAERAYLLKTNNYHDTHFAVSSDIGYCRNYNVTSDDNIGLMMTRFQCSLQWRHNGRDGVSNHQPQDCLLNRLFRHSSKETSKLRVTGLWEGNSPVTGEFPAQRASNAENVSIWWRHHVQLSVVCSIDNAHGLQSVVFCSELSLVGFTISFPYRIDTASIIPSANETNDRGYG